MASYSSPLQRLTARALLSAIAACCALSCRSADPPATQQSPAVTDAQTIATPATQPAQTFECRWTDEPITLDGLANEKAWQNAQVIDNFLIPGTRPGKPHVATKARLLWDREYLYYHADMEDTDLYADITEHNGPMWTNDVFELFFKPADAKPGYYEFEVSAANATMELFIPARGSGGYDRYKRDTKIEMKTAVNLRGTLNRWQDKDTGWSVEGRIRWRDLAPTGGRPNADELWKFALCRGDVSVGVEGPELMSSAPLTAVNFHRYEDYSTLKFVGPDTKAASAKSVGIQNLPPLTTSKVIGYPDPPTPYVIKRVYPKLTTFQPLAVLEDPVNNTLLVLEHLGNWSGPGRLIRLKNDPNVTFDTAENLVDMDRLTMGMALHPDFVHNGYVYIFSNGPVEAENKQDRISRFTIDRKAPYKLDPKSELIILEWDSNGHNGGDIAFGPDGNMYSVGGDGSSDSDRDLRGQNLHYLTSAAIRIDVDHPADGKNYSIPKDNPFIATPGARPEIWAYGFRNPWRIHYDLKSDQFWVGQNGQDAWEQVYLVHKGENYGWSLYEGSHPFNLNRVQGPTKITPPTAEHPHSEMRSLTGGVVYRGTQLPELDGAFIYGDFSTGRIWGVKHDGTKVVWNKELVRTTLQITGFRTMSNGDLVVIDHLGGFYRLEPTPKDVVQPPFPRKLSETGLFTSVKDHTPQPGLIPYDVNSPLWSDGALKERFIALPPNTFMEVNSSRGWDLPEGAVLVKSFSLEGEAGNIATRRRIETRLMTKTQGQWVGYSYLWNDDATDATLVEAPGLDRDYTLKDSKSPGGQRTQRWHYPSRTECMVCHTRASGFVLGINTLQLNKDHDYGNGLHANQLRTMEHLGVLHVDYMAYARDMIRHQFIDEGNSGKDASKMMWDFVATRLQREPEKSTLLAIPPEKIEHLVDPSDTKSSLDLRVRSYLHANCAICHVDAGGGNSLMNLEYGVDRPDMRIFDIPPQHEAFGIKDAKIIATGHPETSVLLQRIKQRGQGQMPPLATAVPDEQALKLFNEWITKSPTTKPTTKPEGSAQR